MQVLVDKNMESSVKNLFAAGMRRAFQGYRKCGGDGCDRGAGDIEEGG